MGQSAAHGGGRPNEAPAARASRREARREAFLKAATEVFLDSGFAGASIDDVIARTGGSKRTIYSYFGNKEELFSAIVREMSAHAMAPLAEEAVRRHDLESTLHDVGRRYLDVLMSPEALKLYRTIVAEGPRFPQLAKAFFESGPGRASASLARALRERAAAWEIRLADYDRAAEHFLGMIRDDLHLKVVLGLRPTPTAEEAEAAVQQAVAIFIHGCRAAVSERKPRGRRDAGA